MKIDTLIYQDKRVKVVKSYEKEAIEDNSDIKDLMSSTIDLTEVLEND